MTVIAASRIIPSPVTTKRGLPKAFTHDFTKADTRWYLAYE
jgi:hypothetical protein